MRGWVEAIAEVYTRTSVGLLELQDRRRFKRGVEARQLLWMLLHDKYGWSLLEIERQTKYDHSTVWHGIRKARAREAKSAQEKNRFEPFLYKEEKAYEALGF